MTTRRSRAESSQDGSAAGRDYALSSLTNAMRLLDAFSVAEPELSVTELALRLGLAKSTVHRLLSTLARGGLVAQNPRSSRYRLGLRLYELGNMAVSGLELREEALDEIEALRNATGETVHVGVRDGCDVVYIERRESNYTLRLFSHIGRRQPVHATSTGKAILAFEPEAVVEQVFAAGLRPLTPHTITRPEALRQCLREIRERGYVVSVEEAELGVASVGAPIRDHSGQVIGAISVAGPVQRLNPQSIPHVVRLVRERADLISTRMGYRTARRSAAAH